MKYRHEISTFVSVFSIDDFLGFIYFCPQTSTHTQLANKVLSNLYLHHFCLSGWNEFICIWISEIMPPKKVPKFDFQGQRKVSSFYLAWIWTPSLWTTTVMWLTNLRVHLAKQVCPPHSQDQRVTKTGNSS